LYHAEIVMPEPNEEAPTDSRVNQMRATANVSSTLFGGRARTKKELMALYEKAGFKVVRQSVI
jgi:hypothetical protein